MFEVPIEGVHHEAGLQEAPQFATPWASSCPAATRYKLTSQQSIPTTACLAVVRESQCGRVWQFLGAYNRSNHVGCLAVAGSLTSHTVWSRQVVNTGDGHRARQHVCPAGSPGTAGSFAGVRSCDAAVLWFTFLCTV